eukprot:gene3615-6431_t
MSETYVELEKQFFVGIPLDPSINTEKEIIQGCIKLHHDTKLLMIPFLEIKTELQPPAPTTFAAFTKHGLLRLCGFIFENEAIGNDFAKIQKDLVKIPIEKCKYLTMTHHGEVEKKDDVWRAIFKIIEEKKLTVNPTYTFETYTVNELHSTDPCDWKTEMYQPLI